MKKFLSRFSAVLLAAVFSLYLPTGGNAAGVLAAEAEQNALPEAGDETSGFTVKSLGSIELIGAETVLFEHDKTGGQVLYIAADDTDRSFDISFKTPALTDKGVSHVFEHICISGSEKYPYQNLFFPLTSRTYNTFVNAFTSHSMTSYPLASLSEEQLLSMTDYYLDGVFNPMIYTEERLFRREAWRYELADAESPITVSGTVYNEMKGTQNIENAAYYNVDDALFPGSIIANNSGGDPDYITDMEWKDLTDYHTAYYHPSNALVILYGDMDYKPFLELLDGYYSQYDKADIEIETGLIEPLTEPVDAVYSFPVESGSPTEKASIISYAGVANGATFEESMGLQFLLAALLHESSPLMEDLREALPGSNFTAAADMYAAPVTIFSMQGDGLNAGDKEVFVATIEEALARIAEEGIDQTIIDALIAQDRFSNLTIPEQSSIGVNLSSAVGSMWSLYDDLDYLNNYLAALDSIEAKSDDGFFEELLDKYIINNSHKAVVTTVPEPGLAEEKAGALASELAELKASMTEEEINALVEETAAMAEWSMEEPPSEVVERFQVIDVENLPEETAVYDIAERDENGVHYMTAEADVADIGSTVLYFDTSAVPREDLHYYNLYTKLIGQLSTESYSIAELGTLITRYLNGFSVKASFIEHEDGGYTPAMAANWMSLNGDYAESAAIVSELLFKTDVTDTDTVLGIVGRLKTAMRNEINQYPYSYQYSRALATSYERYAYTNYLSGIDFYKFLIDAEAALEAEPEAFAEKLASVVEKLAVRGNANALYAGNAEGIEIFEQNVGAVFEGLDEGETIPDVSAFELLPKQNEALVIDSTVQYNMTYATLDELGLTFSGKLRTMANLLYDAYLTPQIRHNIGAYGILTQFAEEGLAIISYRDPSVADTYAAYEGIADFIETSEITQEQIDSYIISVYSTYAMPEGKLAGAINALSLRLNGKPDDFKLTNMREIKSFTLDDLNAMAEAFGKLGSDGIRSTAGGAAAIAENADMFANVLDISALNPNASSDGMTFADVSAQLLGVSEGAFEAAAGLGLYDGEGFEGVTADSTVTREQFAVALTRGLEFEAAESEEALASDIDTVGEWAKAYVDTMLENGFMYTDADGNFNPQASLTPADFEAALTAIMNMAAEAA